MGVVLLLASMGIAAKSLHPHADDGSSQRPGTSVATNDRSWMALGFGDVEGGVTPLYPVQLGQVKSIEVKENQKVPAGTPLFRLDDDLPLLQVKEAQVALDAAKDQLENAQAKVEQFQRQVDAQKAAIDIAKINANLARVPLDKLLEDQKSEDLRHSEAEIKAAKLTVEKAEAAVRAEEKKLAALEALKPDLAVKLARDDVESKKLLVRKAQLALDKCTVRAPFNGTVLRINIGVGETLGSNPRQAAMQFCPDRPRLVRAEVEQEFAGRIRIDQDAVIYDHITGEELGHGKVASLSNWFTQRRSILLDPLQFNDVRTLETIIHLDPSTQTLRIGQRVRVQFPG